jgi:hypothetical protein
MNTISKTLIAVCAAVAMTAVAAEHKHDAKPDLSKLPKASDKTGLTYDKDIKPLFEKSCVKCHSGEKPKGKYVMESLAGVIKGGKEGVGIVAGKSAESPVLLYAADAVEEMEMPPTDKRDKFPALTKDQLALVRAWIDQGAK